MDKQLRKTLATSCICWAQREWVWWRVWKARTPGLHEPTGYPFVQDRCSEDGKAVNILKEIETLVFVKDSGIVHVPLVMWTCQYTSTFSMWVVLPFIQDRSLTLLVILHVQSTRGIFHNP
jgi:hypothetical protein